MGPHGAVIPANAGSPSDLDEARPVQHSFVLNVKAVSLPLTVPEDMRFLEQVSHHSVPLPVRRGQRPISQQRVRDCTVFPVTLS